ncbi:uncharacterized protein LOC126972836 isoform X1 [Leptidea sinapis]|uniref:uncharacterized protein LOC126965991 isoform X1 n=2 Tax=Leptidea sinapis TaxID=189913 RepID=UPI0021C2926F|nr:uncharacterized protein LOC126965991 isoform X1 [Leptidea sinapis]XP_050673443.1 uncharacterized protein LOC126971273 isoform X1 [Leptidea sinapis]XP_050675884.1 uncharacterized protein LOC126972836 isoform X1 [Leptidea sinapis]
MKIDTERVIIEVHLRPVLWDKRNELYKNRDAREAAWRDILKELAPNYENLSEEERKEADKKIQQRWRTARDTYQKDKISEKNQPSGSGSKKKKKYSYYDILTFLDSTTETAGEESLCEEMSEQSNLETPNESTQLGTSRQESSQLTSQRNLETRNESTQPGTSRQESSHPTLKQKQVKSKKQAPSEFEAQLLECLKSKQLELESEDLAFFQSLQPSLKRFTRYQKLMFRTKVLNIVMEMESQTQPAYYSPIPTTSSSAFTELDSLSPINQDYQTNSIIQDTSSLNDNAISSAAVNDNETLISTESRLFNITSYDIIYNPATTSSTGESNVNAQDTNLQRNE